MQERGQWVPPVTQGLAAAAEVQEQAQRPRPRHPTPPIFVPAREDEGRPGQEVRVATPISGMAARPAIGPPPSGSGGLVRGPGGARLIARPADEMMNPVAEENERIFREHQPVEPIVEPDTGRRLQAVDVLTSGTSSQKAPPERRGRSRIYEPPVIIRQQCVSCTAYIEEYERCTYAPLCNKVFCRSRRCRSSHELGCEHRPENRSRTPQARGEEQGPADRRAPPWRASSREGSSRGTR
jgi:hypothetical protein